MTGRITMKTVDARTRRKWRSWLETNHDSVAEVWLIFHKKHTGVRCLSYDDAVEEALCYGWIDSIIKRIDDSCYARKFTPRKAKSDWSESNRRRYEDLLRRGLVTEAGRKRAPHDPIEDGPRARPVTGEKEVEKAFKSNARAWSFYQQLAPSYRKAYVAWICAAKKEETRNRRIREALRLLISRQKLGMK